MSDDSSGSGSGVLDETNSLESSSVRTNFELDKTLDEKRGRSTFSMFNEEVGSFKINREIGRGGMGVVYEATEAILKRRVALKVLPTAALVDEVQIRRFRNEAAAAAQLVHPNIVPVYSVGSDRGIHFYAMQLIDGQNVAQVIGSIRERLSSLEQQKQNADTPHGVVTTQRVTSTTSPNAKHPHDSSVVRQHIEEDFAAVASSRRHPHNCQRLFKSIASLGRDVAFAIQHAHDLGIVHRDIKPSNLLLDDKGKIWVTDFGLAQIRNDPVGTGTGDILGTLRYMSPEQASGKKFLVDHRTDIYSLGVTLYELLTLKTAITGVGVKEIIRQVTFEDPPSMRQVNSRIPAELETIISKAIAKNPIDRYFTAAEFAEDLNRFCNDEPIAARRPSLLQKARRWASGHQTVATAIGGGFALVFLASLAITAVTLRANQVVAKARDATQQQLNRSEGWRLTTLARWLLPSNPGLALALAEEGGKRVAGLEANKTIQDIQDANHEMQLLSPRAQVTSGIALAVRSQQVIFTVDGRYCGKENLPAIIYDLKGSVQLKELNSGSAVTAAVYSPNEDFILTASAGPEAVNEAILWEASTARRLLVLSQHKLRNVWAEMFSSDSTALVAPGPATEATVYRTADGMPELVLRGHSQPVLQAVFSPQGNVIATADNSGEIRLWDAKNGKFLRRFLAPANHDAARLMFSPDGKFVVLATNSGSRSFDLDADKEDATAWWRRETSIAMSPRLNRLAGATLDVINVRELTSGDPICSIKARASVVDIAFSPDGDRLAIAQGNDVRVYDSATGKELYELLGHTKPVTDVTFNKSQGKLITASNDGTVRIWSEQSGAQRQRFETASDGRGSAGVHFSDENRYLLSGSNLEVNTAIFEKSGKQVNAKIVGELFSDAFHSTQIATVRDSRVSIVDPHTSRTILTREFAGEKIIEVVKLLGGKSWAVVTSGGTSVFWDTVTDTILPITKQGDQVLAHDVSVDGTQFLIGTANGRCQVRDSSTGQVIRDIPHPERIVASRFVKDQQRIVTVDGRSRIRVWGENEIVPERVFGKSEFEITACKISADAQYLLTYNENKSQPVCCWDLKTGDQVRTTDGAANQKLVMDLERPIAALASAQGLVFWNFETGESTSVSDGVIVEVQMLGDQVVVIEYPKGVSLLGEEFIWKPQTPSPRIRMYSAKTGEFSTELPPQAGAFGSKLGVNEAQEQFAVLLEVHSASLCDRQLPNTRSFVGNHLAPLSFAQFIPRSRQSITASWDGTVKIWDENVRLSQTPSSTGLPVVAAVISNDGSTLAYGRSDGTLTVWNISSAKELLKLNVTESSITQLAWGPAARSVLVTDTAGKVRLCDLISRESTAVDCSYAVGRTKLSSDGQLALLFAENTDFGPAANLYDLKTGKLEPISDAIFGVLAPQSTKFAAVAKTGTITVYDRTDKRALSVQCQFTPSKTTVDMAFSPDGRLIATLSSSAISLWDVDSGEEVHRLSAPADSSLATEPVTSWTPFSSDSQWLAMRSNSQTNVFAVEPLKTLTPGTFRTLLPHEKIDFHLGMADVAIELSQ